MNLGLPVEKQQVSGGTRWPRFYSTLYGEQPMPQSTSAGFNLQANVGKIGSVVSLGLGLKSLFDYMGSTSDFNPLLTEQEARKLIEQQGTGLFRGINQRAGQAQRAVGAGYAARGLGASGAAVRDIAGIQTEAGQQIADVQAQLSAQLLQMLQYIDQMKYQKELQEAAEQREIAGTVGDLGMLAATLFV